MKTQIILLLLVLLSFDVLAQDDEDWAAIVSSDTIEIGNKSALYVNYSKIVYYQDYIDRQFTFKMDDGMSVVITFCGSDLGVLFDSKLLINDENSLDDISVNLNKKFLIRFYQITNHLDNGDVAVINCFISAKLLE